MMNEIISKEGLSQGAFIAANDEQTTDIANVFKFEVYCYARQLHMLHNSTPRCKDKFTGGILDLIIKQGYEVSAIDSFQFDKSV